MELLAAARLLAGDADHSRLTDLRRAISTTYYAMFHCVAREAADMMVGPQVQSAENAAWRHVYRALDHGTARNACEDRNIRTSFSQFLDKFASDFVSLQKKRNEADYDPYFRCGWREVDQNIATAARAIEEFRKLPEQERRAFCAYILFRKRP